MHGAGKCQSIGVSLDQDSLVASLEQMACPLPFDVDIGRLCTIAVADGDAHAIFAWNYACIRSRAATGASNTFHRI